MIRDGELFLFGAQITPLISASTHVVADAHRTRKLLLHRREIDQLIGRVQRDGYTLVPTALYWKAQQGQGRTGAGQGQADARQARSQQGTRLGAREAARAAAAQQGRVSRQAMPAGGRHSAPAPASVKENVAPSPGPPSARIVPPWRSTMRFTDARPMPCPANSLLAVQALERAEQLVGIFLREARAVVAHEEFAVGS